MRCPQYARIPISQSRNGVATEKEHSPFRSIGAVRKAHRNHAKMERKGAANLTRPEWQHVSSERLDSSCARHLGGRQVQGARLGEMVLKSGAI